MQLTLLQWNVWYREKIENIAGFVEKTKADVICLQELSIKSPYQTVENTPEYLGNKLAYNFYYKKIPLYSTEGNELMLANAVFSRFPIVRQSSFWINIPVRLSGYEDEYRAYVEVSLKVGDKELRIGTTHMSYTDRFKTTVHKEKETNKLMRFIKTKRSGYVFTGDLNALPNSFTVKEINKHLRHAGPDFIEKTWTTKPFSYRGLR